MKPFVKSIMISLCVAGISLSLTAPTIAQPMAEARSLPVTHSLILEHSHNTTTVVQQVMKVGNVSSNDGMALLETLSDTVQYRAHLVFDLTQIPAGATVTQAQLVFHVDRFEYPYPSLPEPGTPITCGIYQIAAAWRSSPTWDWEHNPSIVTDTAYPIPMLFDNTGTYTIEVRELVQAWMGNTPNYGVLIAMYPAPDLLTPFTAVLYGPTVISETLRPRLHIVYERRPTPWLIYLPLVMHGYDTRPDLTVNITQPLNISTPNALQIVVTNAGLRAAHNFWVDVYLDPTQPPAVNQPWPFLCEFYGAAWQIPTLEAGASLTLTIGDAYYSTEYSQWPLENYPAGTHPVWAYVDSWSNQSWGWVREANEENNRAGPVTFTVDETSIAAENLKPTEAFLPRP